MIRSLSTCVLLTAVLFVSWPSPSYAADTDPVQMLKDMDLILRGNSQDTTMAFDVKTKNWERYYKLHTYMKGLDYSFTRVLEPAKVTGQGFLRVKFRLWNYLPSAERTVLIPPSLMLDKFMGSDFSNDDLVKMSYYARDYDAKIAGEESVEGHDTYHLELIPHPDAPITYSKVDLWVRKSDSAPVRSDFYNEKLEIIKTIHYSEFKTFGTHTTPTVLRVENHKDKDHETTLTLLDAKFDLDIPDPVFTRENLEKYP